MQAAAADFTILSLLRAGVQQAWKPGKARSDGAAIGEFDPLAHFVNTHCFGRNAHAVAPGVAVHMLMLEPSR